MTLDDALVDVYIIVDTLDIKARSLVAMINSINTGFKLSLPQRNPVPLIIVNQALLMRLRILLPLIVRRTLEPFNLIISH